MAAEAIVEAKVEASVEPEVEVEPETPAETLPEATETQEILPNDVEESTAIPPIESQEAESAPDDVEPAAQAADEASEPAPVEPDVAEAETAPGFSGNGSPTPRPRTAFMARQRSRPHRLVRPRRRPKRNRQSHWNSARAHRTELCTPSSPRSAPRPKRPGWPSCAATPHSTKG